MQIEGNTLVLSSIYDWYQVDFGKSEGAILNYLQTLAFPALVDRLKTFQGTVSYEYNWQLNSSQ